MILGLVFVLLGAILVIHGLGAFDSVSSGFSRMVTDSPSKETLALVIGGALVVILGMSINRHHPHHKT